MKQNKKIIILFLTGLFLILNLLNACNSSSKSKDVIEYNGRNYKHGDKITVVGFVATVGSEPLTETVLVDKNDRRFLIPPEHEKKLRALGPGLISVTGTLEIKILETVKDHKKILVPLLVPATVSSVK